MEIKQHVSKQPWIKGEIKKYLKTNESGNTTYQNLWDAAKVVVKGRLIAINTYIRNK